MTHYQIYELSARAVISYGRELDGTYTFQLSAAETEKCKALTAPHEQEDNALFYQIMCVLHGDAFTGAQRNHLVTDLSDVIFYMDFSGIFDRRGTQKKYLVRQEKAKALFLPRGRKSGLWRRGTPLSGLRAFRQYEPSGAAVLSPCGCL